MSSLFLALGASLAWGFADFFGPLVSRTLGSLRVLFWAQVGGVLAIGFIVGVGLSILSTKLIASFLFGLTPTDATTLTGSMIVLAIVALLAAYLPARRASHVDPVEALREE